MSSIIYFLMHFWSDLPAFLGYLKGQSFFKPLTPEKKTKLATYAARCIENEVLMYLRTQKKLGRDVSIFEPIGVDKEGQSLLIRDLLPVEEKSAQELLEKNEMLTVLLDHLKILDERELEILTYRFGLFDVNVHTQKQIAQKLKISRSYVSRIEKRALIKLYQQFQRDPQDESSNAQ